MVEDEDVADPIVMSVRQQQRATLQAGTGPGRERTMMLHITIQRTTTTTASRDYSYQQYHYISLTHLFFWNHCSSGQVFQRRTFWDLRCRFSTLPLTQNIVRICIKIIYTVEVLWTVCQRYKIITAQCPTWSTNQTFDNTENTQNDNEREFIQRVVINKSRTR